MIARIDYLEDTESAAAPPIIDLAALNSKDAAAHQNLVDQIRKACLAKGFFQVTNHGIAQELQDAVFQQSKEFFNLTESTKSKYSQANHPNKLGYEPLRSQNFEKRTAGDLKEGFFIGRDLPLDHPYRQQNRIHCGENVVPTELASPSTFAEVTKTYHKQMTALAESILSIIAETLGLPSTYFAPFTHEAGAVLRLLHYPPQPVNSDPNERGIGAHTDFGSITILMQDDVGGLQVFDAATNSWIDVQPTPGALVVNLGNVMMRWSNDRYISNLHRVINKSGKERYSVPFFYSGKPDFEIGCLPGCEDEDGTCKYEPVTVQGWIAARHANTFKEAKGAEEISQLVKASAAVAA
ncbi:putative iron/ascorbate oxido [Cyphellophora attinorum]|uniref:Putative iron/ascorbate oxido n=1 Tax=Cyphellophora attinorum TaxID=1664694 RepID=A0A0N1H6B4_9EURO|nr:putative iron/ascorbate oxido [Phialophora attinorum]KPI38210.1 putative iron/ascorbate oxido [Phialophora attinorum]